eukprot:CAMPEP_0174831354 /NCGR_PEP_ID=MMETSP1114-20130205/3046_1 /TAXON_ID=312471 /ORGANISM="Neobodo designis, Strain CCAP 1951/1" /LENGTH=264 /DNA_ID=CAMNT_0016065177 /DNA_START=75 /DNA_END=866 /DNA_ORIENTATION=+
MCSSCRYRASVNAPAAASADSSATCACAALESRAEDIARSGVRRPIAVEACDLGEAALVEAHRALEEICRANTRVLVMSSTTPSAAASPTLSPTTTTTSHHHQSTVPVPVAVPAGERITPFHSRNPPADLSLYALGCVMRRATKTNDPTMWEALVLFVRYCLANELPPSVHAMHRLYVTCVFVAIKVHDDRYFTVPHYARLAGVGPVEMGKLEAALIDGVGWRTLVTSDDVAALALEPELYVAPLPRVIGRHVDRVPSALPSPS